jgi:hypothetical protein
MKKTYTSDKNTIWVEKTFDADKGSRLSKSEIRSVILRAKKDWPEMFKPIEGD